MLDFIGIVFIAALMVLIINALTTFMDFLAATSAGDIVSVLGGRS